MAIAAGSAAEAQDIIKSTAIYATATGSANAFVVTLPTAPSSLSTGLVVVFKANHTITGAATVNVNSLGATTIKKQGSVDLEVGDIVNGDVVIVVFDGTNFQLQTAVRDTNRIATLANDVTIAGTTTTEQTIISATVPANSLGTANAVRVRIFGIWSGGIPTGGLVLRFKYGATTLVTTGHGASSITTNGCIEFLLLADGATNAQEANVHVKFFSVSDDPDNAITGLNMMYNGTSAIDSTSDQTIAVTHDYESSDAGKSATYYAATIELIR